MEDLAQVDFEAIDRLTLDLLEDACCELAGILSSAQPKAAAAIMAVIERRMADVLNRIISQQSEGEASEIIALTVGERLKEIMDRANGRSALARAA